MKFSIENLKLIYTLGDPIICMNDTGMPGDLVTAYCWINSTFTQRNDADLITKVDYKRERKFHNYYKWVPLMLLFQVSYFSNDLIINLTL